ncbi:MAG: hypothetical protein JWR42_1001 [Marmoricola sp.]|nr:hypothetical protein [Marmoricola sp.]
MTAVEEAPARGSRGALGRKAGWNLVDQAISSLGSAVSAFLIARAVGVEEFGVFGICFAILNFLVGVHRSLGSQPYAIRYSLARGGDDPRRAGDCLTVALATAAVAAPLIMAGALLMDGRAQVLALVIFAALQPFLLVQDAVRSTLLAQGRPRDASVNDAFTPAVQVAGGVTAAQLGAGIDAMIAVWCSGAVLGSLLGCRQLRALPRPSRLRGWLRDVGSVGFPLLGEWVALVGAAQVAFLGIGAIAGVAALGSIRAAQTLLGPLGTFGLAVTAFAVPHLSASSLSHQRARQYAWLVSGVLALVDVAWGAVLLLLPDSVGSTLLGASWTGSQVVLLPLLLQQVAIALTNGPNTLLNALAMTARSFRLAVVHGLALAVLGLTGALVFDVQAATYGFAVASSAVVPLAFWQLRKGLRLRETASAPLSATS